MPEAPRPVDASASLAKKNEGHDLLATGRTLEGAEFGGAVVGPLSLLDEALGRTETLADGVDRAQIRRALALSPAERVQRMIEVAAQQGRIRGKARRVRR